MAKRKKDRQPNCQNKKDKQQNNVTQKTKSYILYIYCFIIFFNKYNLTLARASRDQNKIGLSQCTLGVVYLFCHRFVYVLIEIHVIHHRIYNMCLQLTELIRKLNIKYYKDMAILAKNRPNVIRIASDRFDYKPGCIITLREAIRVQS